MLVYIADLRNEFWKGGVVDMAQLMELLNERRAGMSYERFAQHKLGISGSTFWRYDQGEASIGVDALQKMAERFIEAGDTIIVGAMIAYALGIDVDMDRLNRIGKCLIDAAKIEQAPS